MILHSRQPMFLWWGEELIQLYNDAYLPSFGVGKHPAAMGQRGRDCWQEIWPIIWPQIDDVMSRGKASWNEDALVPIFRNGRLEDVYWTYGYSPVYDDVGGIGGTLVVCTESTGRVVAERALRAMTESLGTTFDSIVDGIIATDVNGAVVRMNPVAEQLTGWSIAEASGRSLREVLRLVDTDTRATIVPFDQALDARPSPEGVAVRSTGRALLVRRDATAIPISHRGAPIKSSDGTIHGAVYVFHDLTAEQMSEAAQRRLQQQLILADRMASVGTLAAGVAHEINNPLTFVTANIESAIEALGALGGGPLSGRTHDLEEMLSDAREGAARVSKIVRGLKSFSRIEEERTSVVDLLPVVEFAINICFNEVRHRGRLVKDYGGLPLVEADEARLGQVFTNIILNAAQSFSPGPTDDNEIRIVTSTDPEGWAVVEVRDTGPGIPPALLGRIFDPFFTTKPVGEGTGLGLAISHNIVTGMGGTLSAESVMGQGTTFRVRLPPCKRIEPPTVASVRTNEIAAPGARILVVDDEPAIGIAIKRILHQQDVTAVTTANEVLALLAAGNDYDVIFSDLMMPEISGAELYKTLEKLYPKMASRVVFVTGGAFTPDAVAFLDQVANERLEKPFNARTLRETVHKFQRRTPID